VPLTQLLLSDLACTSRHSVHRALGVFGEKGWIAWGYGRVRVDAVGELSQFARGMRASPRPRPRGATRAGSRLHGHRPMRSGGW
jgi:hypothetical protein